MLIILFVIYFLVLSLVLSLYSGKPFRYRLQSKMGDSGEEQAIKDLGRIPSWKAENAGKLLPAKRNNNLIQKDSVRIPGWEREYPVKLQASSGNIFPAIGRAWTVTSRLGAGKGRDQMLVISRGRRMQRACL